MMYSQQKLKNKNLDNYLADAKKILNEYDLCDFCIGRLFVKKLKVSSSEILGKKIRKKLEMDSTTNCFICRGILPNLSSTLEKILEKSPDYEFSTFVIGAILKPSITDRDDNLRSKFRLKGIDSVKTSITHQLAQKFAKKTKTKIDFLHPELTITYNFKNDSCDLHPRNLFFHGRYIKKSRGLPQKESSCKNCKGKGCMVCSYHGLTKFSSVEGEIAKFLFEKFQGTQTKIMWIGGEDKNSLVLGSGRPFFAKVLNPKKRKKRLEKKYVFDKLEIHNLKQIDSIPKTPINFQSTIELSIKTNKILNQKDSKLLQSITKDPVVIYEKPNKRLQKKVTKVKFQKTSPKSFILTLTAEGGFPVKRFTEGNEVYPNLSDLLENKCECETFDFYKISLK